MKKFGDIWFSSDPHYYHANVIKYCDRPFASVEEMNEMLITYWNQLVKPGDKAYIQGDFSLAIRPVELYGLRLMGDKDLTPGNHDWVHPHNKKANTPEKMAKWIKHYNEHGLNVKPIQWTLEIPGVANFNITHMPYDTQDGRYQKYLMKDDGRVLLCGHVHQNWKVKRSANGTLMINTGVDVWDMKPVHLDEIIKLIKENS